VVGAGGEREEVGSGGWWEAISGEYGGGGRRRCVEGSRECVTLLQNMFVVSAGKVPLVSAHQADTIYTIRKRRSF
jgi:hypothetical protein